MSRCRTVGGVVRAGTVVDDRYELVELLGAGGFGQVWRAQDLRIGRQVAVKVATPDSREELARLHREAAVAGSLAHPNIVTVHDYGTGVRRKGRRFAYLVMELLPGEPLSVAIERGLDLSDILWVGIDVAHALAAAHDAGLVHRDIKPSNIMLGEDDTKVVDFGITKGADPRYDVTAVNTIIGSPPYMAPECFTGTFYPQSDLYSLGCVIHEMVTGRPPFEGQGFEELARRHRRETPPTMRSKRKGVPAELDDLVAALLEKDPADRPDDAHEFGYALLDLYDRLLGDRAPRTGGDLKTDVRIRPDQVGTVASLDIPWHTACPNCADQHAPRPGCALCEGSGKFRKVWTKHLRIPADLRDGQRLRIRGLGQLGSNGGTSGDMILTVRIQAPAPEERARPAEAPTAAPAPEQDPAETVGAPAKPASGETTARGPDTTTSLTLSTTDAASGRTLRLPVTASAACPRCPGGPSPECPECRGSGRVRHAETRRIRIPAGVRDGQTLRLPGLGDTGSGGEAGDLYVTVRVQAPYDQRPYDQPPEAPAPPPVPDELKARLLAQLAAGPMPIQALRAALPDVLGSAVSDALRAMEGHQVARVSRGVWKLAS